MPDLKGKIAIVTGANSGMGLATVEALSDMGATVIMLCRSEERGRAAVAKLTQEKVRDLDLILCDLGDYASIRNFAERVKEKYPRVDILVNNAGFISLDRQETKEGIERQFGINHLGHFLLTTELLDLMGPGSRIVNVASGAHKVGKIHFDDINLRKGYNVVKAYSQSKLANVLFTRELASRLKKRRISVNCCHPGAVATNIGIDRETGFGKTVTGLLKPFFQTPEEGARTAIYLATDPAVANMTGGYFYMCKPAKSSKLSKDKALAGKLFALSEELVRGGTNSKDIGGTIMSEQRIYEMEQVKKEDPKVAVKTPFYQTDSTGGSVWVIKPGQTLQKHCHHHSDDIWIVLQGEGVFYPEPDKEVPFHKGQVIVSPKGACHGALNTGNEDIIFVSIVAPLPCDYDPIQ